MQAAPSLFMYAEGANLCINMAWDARIRQKLELRKSFHGSEGELRHFRLHDS